ncbi:T9SS type A sorting domain-containing protein [Reichenbachiella agarivorans]|uniref:T9SS type A sorting domain-containing protein n=1 Tax=Reichenbachiella agarivorans TaxID=2979464 RepID=A0ABY6CRK9_9BACT|nr:T9SS type A sorting domain-containing protein [Reichenbachiella agarivorans]UXP33136.1 T9SS type A sorting domain-containing protein [Reichenbachiella agarivorans]
MKTTFKTIAIAVMVAMSTLSFAGKNGEKAEKAVSAELAVRIVAVDEASVAVIFAKLEGEEVKVKIYDAYGALVHTEKETEGTSFTKKFDISALPAGDYTYMVANDLYSVKKVIAKN